MKIHQYSKALSWITRPRVTETATAETYTPELERMNFKPEKSKADQYKEYLKAEPFLEPESQIYARDQLGFDDGGSAQLVQPGQSGVRQRYMGEEEVTKLAKEYQKITGSDTTLPNIKSKIRHDRITKKHIEKYKLRGPYGSGFRGKEIEALSNVKSYKAILAQLNKIKKQKNNNIFFGFDDVIKTGKWYKNLRTKLGNLNDVDVDLLIKKVLREEFPGSYYGLTAMRDFRRDKVVEAFINYLDVNGTLDGHEKRLPELKQFRGTGKKTYRNIIETFKEWTEGEFEVKGIDRKNLNVDQLKEIKNWSPGYSSIKSIANEKQLKFLNDLNTNSPSLSSKEVRQKFFKKFPDTTEGMFNHRITHLTQLKNSGEYSIGGGASRTYKWIVPDKKRSSWLKELLGLKFQGNYSSFINRGDKLLAQGLTKEADRLYAAAEKYFGTSGVFTKYEGQGEHPFSRIFGSGPIGNELKINSLVRGDLNQFKRLNFDEPVIDLFTEYNKNTTTLKRKDEIKTLIEDRKKLMNFLTEGSNEKGIVEPVKFNYGPKKMTVSADVVDIDKVKNFNVEDYVKRGKSYLDAFQKKGKTLGLIDTETGRIIKQAMGSKDFRNLLQTAKTAKGPARLKALQMLAYIGGAGILTGLGLNITSAEAKTLETGNKTQESNLAGNLTAVTAAGTIAAKYPKEVWEGIKKAGKYGIVRPIAGLTLPVVKAGESLVETVKAVKEKRLPDYDLTNPETWVNAAFWNWAVKEWGFDKTVDKFGQSLKHLSTGDKARVFRNVVARAGLSPKALQFIGSRVAWPVAGIMSVYDAYKDYQKRKPDIEKQKELIEQGVVKEEEFDKEEPMFAMGGIASLIK